MKKSFYINVSYINKPKNQFEEEMISLLKLSDGNIITDLEDYKRNWIELIQLIKRRYSRVKHKEVEWRKSVTVSGKEKWFLTFNFIGFELLEIRNDE